MDFNELKKAKVTDVDSCDGCPAHFYLGQYPPSAHCSLAEGQWVPGPGHAEYTGSIPEWCPLREHPVILNLSRYIKVGHEMEG